MQASSVVRYAGISYRQLDHWVRERYLNVAQTGSGHHRDFAEREAVVAWWVARLAEAGLTHVVAAQIARRIVRVGKREGRFRLNPEVTIDLSGLVPPPLPGV